MKSLNLITLSALGLSLGLQAQEKKPNIVFFLTDDLGWTDLGYMGSDFYESPNLDAFAQESLNFTQAYSNAPNSAPSRSCLMTGKFTPRHGVFTVSPSDRGRKEYRKLIPIKNTDDVRGEFVTMAEMLSANGYACGHVGKWHMGLDGKGTGPLDQGFISNVAGTRAGHPYSYFYPYKSQRGEHPGIEEGEPGEYLTDRMTTEGIRFIEEHKDGPFFLYLSQYAVHGPLKAPQPLIDRFKAKPSGKHHDNPVYAAMIANLDWNFGRVRDALDSLGLSDNTILIFYSDNGGPEHTSNYPLRGYKGMGYEGGIRVPLLIRWPGHIRPGKTEVPVYGIDFYPTFARIAGSEPAADLDGDDIFDLLSGKIRSRDMFWHFPAYLEGSRNTGHFRTTPFSSIRSGDWKLLYYYEDGRTELYNIAEDISEKNDQSKAHPEIVKKLHSKLKKWLKDTDAPIPTEKNPYYDPNF